MRKEKRIHGKEKIFHRCLALLMVAILLLGDQNLSVLAENETTNVELSEEASDEVSMEETGEADEGSVDGTGDTEDKSKLPGDENIDNDDKNICVCDSRCSADMVNADCPICVENYDNCGGSKSEETEEGDGSIAGEEGELPDETELPEETEPLTEVTISENDVEAEAGPENEGIETYTVGDVFSDGKLTYKIIDEDNKQVEIIQQTADDIANIDADLVIPETVDYNGSPYSVTSIGKNAFTGCYTLISVKIPNSVTNIRDSAFDDCINLTSVEIPDNVTNIGNNAFYGCRSLTSIKIPNSMTSIGISVFVCCSSLTSVEIPDNITSIGEYTFAYCSSLTSVEIPDSVTSIGHSVFMYCSSLTSIEIPNSVTNIGGYAFAFCSSLTSAKIPNSLTSIDAAAFENCEELRTLQIVIPSDEIDISVPEVHKYRAFYGTPEDRYIVFVSENGSLLTDNAFEVARAIFKEDDRDGNATDDLWWGWNFKEPTASSITIKVRKDNSDWSTHTRKFGLIPIAKPDAALITDLTLVADGQYKIYDITDAADTSGTDTGETITVSSGTGEATVDYYTVTFYDGDTAYAADAPQAPQTVLKGKKASEPTAAPTKPGHQFKEWVTEKNGSSPFDFENTVIEDTTSIYADWTANAYNITYHLDGYEASQKDSTYTYGTDITLPAPTRSGYAFDGWYTNADYSGEKVTSIGSTETGNKVYYGRWIKKSGSTYRVSVKVQRDGVEWKNHGKTFMLLTETGNLTENFETVAQGIYYIYDVTGAPSEPLATDGVNTDIRVSVVDKNVEATVDYYTVTFYDGSTAYDDSTPQAMQTVLGGKTAKEPEVPSKEGYTFNRWMTANNGSEAFNFNVPIERKSNVYASWISTAATEYNIEASAGGGGSISPKGSVKVQEGGSQTFEITPNDGYKIKAVTVDGIDRTNELTNSARAKAIRAQTETSRYYTFVNIRESHTIRAAFEKENDNSTTGGGGGSSDTSVINVSIVANAENTGGSPTEIINNGNDTNNTTNSSKDTEPKTEDTSHVEVYATMAMITGLAYLLLYFADRKKGMTEERKQELISSMLRWAKRGSRIRKYMVLVPIFILLCYYHSIGKCVDVELEKVPV